MRCQQTLLLLSFLGAAILYAMRVNLSLAIVAMTGAHLDHDVNAIKSFEYDCPNKLKVSESQALTPAELKGEFQWNEKLQGKILGMFFYGYLMTNILGGRLSEIFGGKIVFGCGVALPGLLSLLAPSAARHSVESFMILRFLQGMTSGVTFPSLATLMAQWVPPPERSRFISCALGGTAFGTVVTLASSGWFISNWGWPYVFYISGLLSLIWLSLWSCFVYDSPACHPNLSKEERDHLELTMAISLANVRPPVPWCEIMRCPPFLAIVAAHFGLNWGFYALLTELPTYLSTVHQFDMKNNGLVSAMPYLSMWVFSISYSTYMDKMLHRGKASFHSVRRNSSLIALLGPMVALMLISEVGCRSDLVIIIISLGLASMGASFSGFHCGFQELAPNFAGTLTGISNTIATFPGVLAPFATGTIINEQPTIRQWRFVFHLGAFIYLFSALFYLRFMSVEKQPWNNTSRLQKENQ